MTTAEREFGEWIETPGAKAYYNWKTGTETFPLTQEEKDFGHWITTPGAKEYYNWKTGEQAFDV